MAKIKKYQNSGKPLKATPDSSAYYKNQEDVFNKLAKSEKGNSKVADFNRQYFKSQSAKAVSDQLRQLHKGKPGYDANGFPIKKNKTGGKVTKAKDGKWIQKATASIKKRGTEGVCTGKKFGGPTCKPGSKRYNLAKVFKGMAKKKK